MGVSGVGRVRVSMASRLRGSDWEVIPAPWMPVSNNFRKMESSCPNDVLMVKGC